jgi:hypothetical protein
MSDAASTQIVIQIITSVVTIISILTVFVKIGAWKGKQEQLNENQSETNKRFQCDITKNSDKIDIVESGLAVKIEGVERRLSDRIDKVKDDLSAEIRNAKV